MKETKEKLKLADAKVMELKAQNKKVLSKYIKEESQRKLKLTSVSLLAEEHAEMIKS